MKGPADPFSLTEKRVRAIITGIVGPASIDYVGAFFGIASVHLREAARCYDDGDYLASCVMSRGALEAALYGFVYSAGTSRAIQPPRDKKKRVRPRLEDLCDQAKQKLSGNNRRAAHRIAEDGHRSAHLAERFWEGFWRMSDRARSEQSKPIRERRAIKPPKRWPEAPEALRNLLDVSKIVGKLARAKLDEATRPGMQAK